MFERRPMIFFMFCQCKNLQSRQAFAQYCDLEIHSSMPEQILVFTQSPLLAAATGLFGLRIVLSKVGKHGRLPTRLYGFFAKLGWPIQSAV
jgi:hypothetical protein